MTFDRNFWVPYRPPTLMEGFGLEETLPTQKVGGWWPQGSRIAGWVTLLLISSSVSSFAQEGDPPPEASPEQTETPTETDNDSTNVESVGAAEARRPGFGIDPSEIPVNVKKERVESMLTDQRAALARTVEILSSARASKDIVQLNCVNEKLTQIKGLLKISEQASLQMYEAIASSAEDLINHEYTKIVVAHQRTQVLLAEAEQCVGESSVYGANTEVEVDIEGEDGFGSGSGGDGSGGGFGGDPTTASAPPPGPAVPPVASTF